MDGRWMTFGKKRPSRHFELSDTMRTDKHARDREKLIRLPCHKDYQDSTVISAPMLTGSTHFFTYQLQVCSLSSLR